MSNIYKAAGVDLEAGYASVDLLRDHVARTKRKGAMDSLGAFGGMFDLSALQMKEPVLVSGTDGVGTKLLLAFACDKHDTIGIDVVAMCVNDVLVQGALPLYFLDYIAVGKNQPEKIEQVVKGIADGCVLSDCALIGGETAEMPDMYEKNHYDLAGFCVGAVEKKDIIDGKNLKEGQVLLGLPSSGIHSNGYALVRKIFFKDHDYTVDSVLPSIGRTVGESLLEPTKIYVSAVRTLLQQNIAITGMAHITGGGFYENLPRMLKGHGCTIDIASIQKPAIFDVLQELGNIDKEEMYHIFNMGIGYVIAMDASDVDKAIAALQEVGEQAYPIGVITTSGKVDLQW